MKQSKCILILGGTSDVGKALAIICAEKGHKLILAARKHKRMEPMAQDIRLKHDCRVELTEFDALDTESHEAFYSDLPFKPDVAICVFGYLGDLEKAPQDFVEARKIMDTNYTGAVSILHIIAKDMKERGEGIIAGVSSIAGERGRGSNYYYGSAKAGFSTFLDGLRNYLHKTGVHVVTVKPGYIHTKMISHMKTPGFLTATPEQAAKAIYRACRRRKNRLYTLTVWRPVMTIVKSIPESIFKKMKL